MFTLKANDHDSFKKLMKLVAIESTPLRDSDDVSVETIAKTSGLGLHYKSYVFAESLLKEKVDLNNKKHQSALALSLEALSEPSGWGSHEKEDQRILLSLLALKCKSENYQAHYEQVAKGFLQNSSYVASAFITNPWIAAGVIVPGIALGSSDNRLEGIGPEILIHMDKLSAQDIIASKIPLTNEGLVFLLGKQDGQLNEIQELLAFHKISLDDVKKTNTANAFIHKAILDSLQKRIQSQQEAFCFEENLKNFKSICHSTEVIADKLNLGSDVKRFAVGASNIADLYKNYKDVAKGFAQASKALAAKEAISTASLLATAASMANMATAAVQIFSLFMKNKQDDVMKELFKQLQGISEQIQALHKDVHEMRKEMHELFRENFERQKLILDVLCQGFTHLDKLINRKIDNIGIPILSSLITLQKSIDRLMDITVISNEETQNLKYQALNNSFNAYLNGREKPTDKEIQKMDSEFLAWIGGTETWVPYAASPLYTGTVLQMARDFNLDTIITDLSKWDESSLTQRIGYLAICAERFLGFSLENTVNVRVDRLFNPVLWLNGVNDYVRFRSEFNHGVLDPKGESLRTIENIGNNALRFLEWVSNAHGLFEKLLESYQHSVLEADGFFKRCLQRENQKHSTELVKKIANEKPEKLAINLAHTIEEALQSFSGHVPKNVISKGSSIAIRCDGLIHIASKFTNSSWTLTDLNDQQIISLFSSCFLPEIALSHYMELGKPEAHHNIEVTNPQVNTGNNMGRLTITMHLNLSEKRHSFQIIYPLLAQSKGNINWGHTIVGQAIDINVMSFYQSILNTWRGSDTPGLDQRIQIYPYGESHYQKILERALLGAKGTAYINWGDPEVKNESERSERYAKAKQELETRICAKWVSYRKDILSAEDRKAFEEKLKHVEAYYLLLKAFAFTAGVSPEMLSDIDILPGREQLRTQYEKFMSAPNVTLPAIDQGQFKKISSCFLSEKNKNKDVTNQSELTLNIHNALLMLATLKINLQLKNGVSKSLTKTDSIFFASIVIEKINQKLSSRFKSKALANCLKKLIDDGKPMKFFVEDLKGNIKGMNEWVKVADELVEHLLKNKEIVVDGLGRFSIHKLLIEIEKWHEESQYRDKPLSYVSAGVRTNFNKAHSRNSGNPTESFNQDEVLFSIASKSAGASTSSNKAFPKKLDEKEDQEFEHVSKPKSSRA